MNGHHHDQHDGHDHHEHRHGSDGHRHHHHHEPPAGFDRAFAVGSLLNAGFVVAEVTFGITAHSVALVADAAHNLGDVLGLLLAWGAAALGRRYPTSSRTYGYGRSSILASLINAVVLLIGIGGVIVEAIRRLSEGVPSGEVDSNVVMIVAGAGILVNGLTALLFVRRQSSDLNVRGAFLHMVADAAVSAGVVVTGLVMMLTGWAWLDPVASLLIAALILFSTWGLLRDSINLALDKVPETVDEASVRAYLAAMPGVVEVHDLHIWALSTTETALTVHLVRPNAGTDDALLQSACETLRERFGIGHATFQIEEGDTATVCQLAPSHIV
jgi:cobalt-zinc-cadmium efflux system protein